MVDTRATQRSELLIVKTGDDYVRFREDGYERCAMNKASVFPVADLELLREKCERYLSGDSGYILRKLVIIEEPFEG